MANPTVATDPAADPAAADTGEASPGYVIEIHVSGAGDITVGVESDAAEGAESDAAEGAEEGASESAEAQPVSNIKAALVMALDIFKSNGAAPVADDSEEQMSAGFNGDKA